MEVRVDNQVSHFFNEGNIAKCFYLLSLDTLHIINDSLVVSLAPVTKPFAEEKLHLLAKARSHILYALLHLNGVTKAITEL